MAIGSQVLDLQGSLVLHQGAPKWGHQSRGWGNPPELMKVSGKISLIPGSFSRPCLITRGDPEHIQNIDSMWKTRSTEKNLLRR